MLQRTRHERPPMVAGRSRPDSWNNAMIFSAVGSRVCSAEGDSSPIRVTEIMADTPEEASARVTRLEFQRRDCPPVRSVNIRAVEIVDRAEQQHSSAPRGE